MASEASLLQRRVGGDLACPVRCSQFAAGGAVEEMATLSIVRAKGSILSGMIAVRGNCSVAAAAIQGDVEGISTWSHGVGVYQ